MGVAWDCHYRLAKKFIFPYFYTLTFNRKEAFMPAFIISGQYEFRSTRFILINDGSNIVGLAMMGLIPGAWK